MKSKYVVYECKIEAAMKHSQNDYNDYLVPVASFKDAGKAKAFAKEFAKTLQPGNTVSVEIDSEVLFVFEPDGA